MEPGPQCLNPQMVLFVDHHADVFFTVQHNAAAGILGRVFTADKMPFHQNLFVQGGQLIHRFGKNLLPQQGQGFDRWHQRLKGLNSLCLLGMARERDRSEIARQTNPAGEHDFVVRATAQAGLGGGDQKIDDTHVGGIIQRP